MKIDRLIIFTSLDPDSGEWVPLAPDKVPETIKNSDVMGNLVAGSICQIEGESVWYRAEKHHA